MAPSSSATLDRPPRLPASERGQVVLLVRLTEACRTRVDEEVGRLEDAMENAGDDVAVRRRALRSLRTVVTNTQRFLANVERTQDQLSGDSRELRRAYWSLRRTVDEAISAGTTWKRHIAASTGMGPG